MSASRRIASTKKTWVTPALATARANHSPTRMVSIRRPLRFVRPNEDRRARAPPSRRERDGRPCAAPAPSAKLIADEEERDAMPSLFDPATYENVRGRPALAARMLPPACYVDPEFYDREMERI